MQLENSINPIKIRARQVETTCNRNKKDLYYVDKSLPLFTLIIFDDGHHRHLPNIKYEYDMI